MLFVCSCGLCVCASCIRGSLFAKGSGRRQHSQRARPVRPVSALDLAAPRAPVCACRSVCHAAHLGMRTQHVHSESAPNMP